MAPLRDDKDRKLLVIDLENLLYGQHKSTPIDVLAAQAEAIRFAAQARRATDQLIVGCNPQLLFSARGAFPDAQLVSGKGKDGADLALLDKLEAEHVASRFSELCIVSGDHTFSDIARDVRRFGASVRVLGPRGGISQNLRLAADHTLLIPVIGQAEPTDPVVPDERIALAA